MEPIILNIISNENVGRKTLIEKSIFYFEQKVKVGIITFNNELKRFPANVFNVEKEDINKLINELISKKYEIIIIMNNYGLDSPIFIKNARNMLLMSVDQKENLPLIYPELFKKMDYIVITKFDLLDRYSFDISRVRNSLDYLKGDMPVFLSSSKDNLLIKHFAEFFIDEIAEAKKGR